MTKQCGACNKFMQVKGGAACKSCTGIYHKACLLMPETARLAADWMCPDCHRKMPKADNTATPVKGAGGCIDLDTSHADLDQQLKIMTDQLRDTIRAEIRLAREDLIGELKRELVEVRAALVASTLRIESLEKRLEVLETTPKHQNEDRDSNAQLNETVKQLKLELNERDQELLSSDLEIANFPETSGENVLHTVGLVAGKLGVALEPRDVMFAERVGYRRNTSDGTTLAPTPRRIVVRLARRGLRDEMLAAARARRGLNSADLGLAAAPRPFYINERLTRHNKLVFFRVRELGAKLGWKYTWTKHGKILAKQAEGGSTFAIRSLADLERVFGKDNVCSALSE